MARQPHGTSKFVWLACAWRRMGRLFHAANCRCFLHFFSLPFVKSCGERQTFLVRARQTQRRGGIFFLSLSQLERSLFRPSSKQLTWPNKYFTNTFSRLHNFRWLISQQRGSRPTLYTGRARAPPSFLPSLSKWNIGTHGAFAPRRERAIKKWLLVGRQWAGTRDIRDNTKACGLHVLPPSFPHCHVSLLSLFLYVFSFRCLRNALEVQNLSTASRETIFPGNHIILFHCGIGEERKDEKFPRSLPSFFETNETSHLVFPDERESILFSLSILIDVWNDRARGKHSWNDRKNVPNPLTRPKWPSNGRTQGERRGQRARAIEDRKEGRTGCLCVQLSLGSALSVWLEGNCCRRRRRCLDGIVFL